VNPSKYHFELWSPSGELLADLAGRAQRRQITQSRNEAEDIQWQLDINELEDLCRRMNTTPDELINPGSTEVRIRRGSSYLCGGQITYRDPNISEGSQYLDVRATGFLNLFKSRYTDAPQRVFSAVQATTIAATLINETQAKGADWDFGVTIGSLATVGVHDRTYIEDEIKDSLQRLTRVQTAPFDFEFTADKVFNTYARLGSERPEIIFEYPGNVKSLRSPKDATGLANSIRVQGSGSGTDGSARAVRDGADSQHNYKVREKKVQESSTVEVGTLEDDGDAELAAWAYPFEVPMLSVDGNVSPLVTDYGIGDYLMFVSKRYRILAALNGFFRLEKRVITIDEDDNEDVQLMVTQ
jgi:hypothetical protein